MLWSPKWFPGTNLQDINLDWILKKVSALRGGAAGQVLSKKTATDFDFEWVSGGGGSGTTDYLELENKPSINNVELVGNKTAANLGLGTYSKPSGGIPKSDLASAVRTSLSKADTALQAGALPTGGAVGQIPIKVSETDFDTEWRYPFDQIQNVATSGTDLNNYTTGGCYYFQSNQSPLNKPDESGTYGFLMVLHGTELSRLVQYWIDTNTNKIWMRTNHVTNVSWSDWERFVNQADLTPTPITPVIADPLPAGITTVENVNVVQYGAIVQVGISLIRDTTAIVSFNNGIIATGLPRAAFKPFVGSTPIPNCYITAAGGAHTGRELQVNVGATGSLSVRYGETAGTYRAVFFYLTDDLAVYN